MRNGRKYDVLLERVSFEDKRTGVMIESEMTFDVWADEGSLKTIEAVEGVIDVSLGAETRYRIYIDKRYDIRFIMAEVEAVLKIARS